MAATNVQSADGGNNSPKVVASPWNQVVRGAESEVVSPVTVPVVAPASPSWSLVQNQEVEVVSSPDDSGTEGGQVDGGSDNSGGSKKPVWNRPSNGVVEVVGPVMGAAWPALGESTKPAIKSSSSESLKTLSDGLLTPTLQVTGSSSPSHKQATANNVISTSTPNHMAPVKQRSMKRTGGHSGANVSANGVLSQPPSMYQDSVVDPHITSGKAGNNSEQPFLKDHTHKESQKGGFGSHSHRGNDHHHQRGSFRRGNGGQHPRGDGSHHNNYGGRRDHDRSNQEWNQQNRSFNNRDTQFQSHRGFPRGYIRPSVHTSASYIPPPLPVPVPVPTFGNNMMYPDPTSPVIYISGPPADPLRPMPFGPPLPPPMYFAYPDNQTYAKIVSQIDYYFSNENLVKDTYLRQNMDEQGWVPATLIAGFKKVSVLTDNVQLILDAMRSSTVVEVQGEKIRRRNDWMNWVIPAPVQYSNPSSPHADGLVSKLQGVKLHEPSSTYEEVTSPSQQAGGEKTVRGISQQTGSEPATGA
ncbi:la-related protein 1C [Rutidosis leptorrhynchoides]|uniref:la-related protein 1C n=1 Tax=Rutidosis leptorrhynchoides TaxID=125765 RepID=UPI003A99DADC